MEKKHIDSNEHLQNRTSQISLGLGASALVISLVMSGLYIVDTVTGDTNLRNVLATLGICKPLDLPTPTPTPSTSESATDGTDGTDGNAGTDGTDGAVGPTGPAGTDGNAGTDGTDGTDGNAGTDGTDGAVGPTGPAGPDGTDGVDGAVGPTGPAGPCTYVLDLALIDGNLVPSEDDTYSLGSSLLRWKDLQLGPGTLYIEDQVTGSQVGVTVIDGALLLDGADSLRIGNIRLTPKGIESIASDEDIEIGNLGDTGYVLMARGLKFPDGTIQTTATLEGPEGPEGPRGPAGPEGPAGSVGDYREQKACVQNNHSELIGQMHMGTCDENRKHGTDIVILMKLP